MDNQRSQGELMMKMAVSVLAWRIEAMADASRWAEVQEAATMAAALADGWMRQDRARFEQVLDVVRKIEAEREGIRRG